MEQKLFGKDSYLFGLLAWIIAGLLGFGMVLLLQQIAALASVFGDPKVQYLLALVPSLGLIRYFLVNKKWERSGGAVVVLTFLAGLLVFVLVK